MASGRRGDTSAIPEGVSDNDTSEDEAVRIDSDVSNLRHSSQETGGISSSSFGHLEPSDHSFCDVPPCSPTTCSSPPPIETCSTARPSSSGGKRSRSSSMPPSARSRLNIDASDVLNDLVEQGRQRLEIANEILRRDKLARPTVHSIDECMHKLEKIPGITPECILAAGDAFKEDINRWFFMHYEGSLLQAWLNRQMADFY